ncbi:YeeE/YedE family protein [Parashewanella curva]|uniref:YeeE/YedE family protein n=1 Tax=Parashewanella curva TaxID=2338552 RepID=A0A3L8PXD6_9GAMM|nr:DUF6691 family protein [Parashewanella curva]RLV58732.1 YeeE/YedE family protein [Parashewanella curva]
MKHGLISLASGLFFGIGMAISGMVNPNNVIGFLDIFGNWNPSLIFVMGGALAVFMPSYLLVIKPRVRPIFESTFSFNLKKNIDKNLVFGASLFGVGWGLAGICPGPAVTALSAFNLDALFFLVFMMIGMKLAGLMRAK